MPRRIAHIIATLDRAGAEKQLTLLCRGLARDEFEPHVAALTRGGPYEATLREAGIPVTVIGKRGKLDPMALWKTRQWLRDLQPALVHTWMFTANAYGRAAAMLAGVAPLVAAERCLDPWKRWPHLAIDRALARRTARVVMVSDAVRQFYVERGIPEAKCVVIPGGVEPHMPDGRTREELLAELGLPSDARLIASVGRLWPQKRLKDAIWAADLLKVIRDDAHLLILGDGPQRAALMHYRDRVEIRDRVHFLGQRDDAPQIVAHCDLLWQSSAYEGVPNAVLEALAAAVPVVATDIPGVRELVRHGETGLLVKVGDRAALARHANTLLNDAPLRRRLGEAGREHVLREFSVAAMVESHAAVYREVLAEAAR